MQTPITAERVAGHSRARDGSVSSVYCPAWRRKKGGVGRQGARKSRTFLCGFFRKSNMYPHTLGNSLDPDSPQARGGGVGVPETCHSPAMGREGFVWYGSGIGRIRLHTVTHGWAAATSPATSLSIGLDRQAEQNSSQCANKLPHRQ